MPNNKTCPNVSRTYDSTSKSYQILTSTRPCVAVGYLLPSADPRCSVFRESKDAKCACLLVIQVARFYNLQHYLEEDLAFAIPLLSTRCRLGKYLEAKWEVFLSDLCVSTNSLLASNKWPIQLRKAEVGFISLATYAVLCWPAVVHRMQYKMRSAFTKVCNVGGSSCNSNCGFPTVFTKRYGTLVTTYYISPVNYGFKSTE